MVAQPPPMVITPTSSSTDDHSSAADLLDSASHSHPQPLAAAVLMKRKRTKRPRHHPPPSAAAASSSGESTTTEEEDMAHCLILLAQGAAGYAAVDSNPSPSPAPQQQPSPTPAVDSKPPARTERYSSRKYTEAAATPDGARAGFYVYECKTCNKCFPTFQALGGHRASHKKPRLATGVDDDVVNAAPTTATSGAAKQQSRLPTTTMATTASPPPPPTPLQPHQPHVDVITAFPDVTTALGLNTSSVTAAAAVTVGSGGSKLRVHECSICGAEFASGQALGGHMRRHRPLNAPDRAVTAITTAETNVQKEASAGTINLELDLNLPAPSDEGAMPSPLPPPPPPAVLLGLGQFNDGNKAGLVLTASALVDCHY